MEIQEIIHTMDLLRSNLDALRPIPEDRINRLNQKLRLDWNYHSNSIEGNTLTVSETKAFLLHGITSQGKPFRDYIEMRGHNEALKKLESIIHQDLKITESLIKEFHKIILVEPYAGEAEINPGEYKTLPNYLYSPTGERIDFEPPQEVPRLMNELINWLNNQIDPPKRKKKKYDLHPLYIACAFHVRFIQIHPFGDGNGRMARILMNLILMLCGYVPAIIKLDKRKEYYAALNFSSIENIDPLAEFVGQECIQSLQMAIKAAKGESIEDADDLDKKLTLLKQEVEAEDNEKEIKTGLTFGIVNEAFNQWVYALFSELALTASKFNEFYNEPNHVLDILIDNKNKIFSFRNEIPSKEIKDYLSLSIKRTIFIHAIMRFMCSFGAYKKGGLNPFGCNYSIEIRFERYHYEVLMDYFDKESKGLKTKSFIKKLLHKPLVSEEIMEINRQWGESLYNHLDYNRKQLNGNDSN